MVCQRSNSRKCNRISMELIYVIEDYHSILKIENDGQTNGWTNEFEYFSEYR